MTFLTAWILPATTARRTQHVSLVLAGLVHIIALIIAVGILLFVIACVNYPEPLTLSLIKKKFVWLVADVLERMPLQALPVLPRVLGSVVIVELVFVCLALLLAPWGARDEPMSASCRHALRRVWLQTAHLVQLVLIVSILAIVLVRAEQAWEQADPPPSATPETWREWYDTKPWYIKNAGYEIVTAGVASAVWMLWTLLRAVGAQRKAVPIDRPPTCEACGYNLSGTAVDSVCPECGEAVTCSLGAGVRPGTDWERRAEVGRWKAWRKCCADAVFHPKKFGGQIQMTSLNVAHRSFLACHLPLVFCLGGVGFIACVSLRQGVNLLSEFPVVALLAGAVIGCLSVITSVGLIHLAAFLAALQYRLEGHRNLMAGSIQVACYLSGYLVFGVVLVTVTASAAITASEYGLFRGPARFLHVDSGGLAFLCWSLPNAIFLIVYFLLVFRGTSSIRYANR